MRFLNKTIIFITLFLNIYAYEANAVIKEVTVLPIFSGDASSDASCRYAVERIKKCFADLGRYRPVSEVKLSRIKESDYRSSSGVDFKKVFETTGSTIVVGINISIRPSATKTIIVIYDRNEMIFSKEIDSKLSAVAVPLAVRQTVLFHKKIPLIFSIEKKIDGNYIIDAGEFHGLRKDKIYNLVNEGSISVIDTSRYSSLVKMNKTDIQTVKRFEIEMFPEIKSNLKILDDEISELVIKKYGSEYSILAGIPDTEKRFAEGLVVINTGANIILPGYGAFLSTYYMGFKNPEPSYAGIGAAIALETFQLMYIPYKTDYNGNFFPWINDSSKSSSERRLHKYLWATIPVTWAVAYCDQLSYQYERSRVLPPLFINADSSAFALSLFVPGGGLFYKGYRLEGWSFYLAEFSLAGYYTENKGSKKARYSLIGAGAVKLAELACAALFSPSYSVYKDEIEKYSVVFDMSLKPDYIENRVSYEIAACLRY